MNWQLNDYLFRILSSDGFFLNYQAGYFGGVRDGNFRSALGKAKNMFVRSKRKHASQILIVISASKRPGSLGWYGQTMKMSGVSIFAFGIGRSDKNQLRKICSSSLFCMFDWNFRSLRRRQIIKFLSNLNNGTLLKTFICKYFV